MWHQRGSDEEMDEGKNLYLNRWQRHFKMLTLIDIIRAPLEAAKCLGLAQERFPEDPKNVTPNDDLQSWRTQVFQAAAFLITELPFSKGQTVEAMQDVPICTISQSQILR